MHTLHNYGHVFDLAVVYNFISVGVKDFAIKLHFFYSGFLRNYLFNKKKFFETRKESLNCIINEEPESKLYLVVPVINELLYSINSIYENQEAVNNNYISKFQLIHIIGGLFSFVCLFNSGYSEYISDSWVYKSHFVLIVYCILIYGFFFIYSFFPFSLIGEFSSSYEKNKNYYEGAIILSFLFVLLNSYLFTPWCHKIIHYNFPNHNCVIIASVIVAIGPFLLTFIRVILGSIIQFVYLKFFLIRKAKKVVIDIVGNDMMKNIFKKTNQNPLEDMVNDISI